MIKRPVLKVLIIGLLGISVQTAHLYAGPVETEKPERYSDCDLHPFAQWCSIAGFGVSFGTSTDGGSYIGLSGSYGVFIFDRAALTLGTSYTAFEKYDTYAAGPSLNYYIGPVAGWFITPGVTLSRVWVQGSDLSITGYIYGPGVAVQSMIGQSVLYGLSVYYITSVYNNTIYSEMQYSPAVSILF